MAESLKAKVINAGGGSTRERVLPEEQFGGEINIPLMHQVVTAQLAAARSGTASTKTRAEVRGGGKKPWRQKGTGRARHGSSRSPIWVGGGTVFGPKPRDHSVKVPKKMRKAALRSALATKAQDGCIWVLYDWSETKTRPAASVLQQEGIEGRTLLVLDPADEESAAVDRAFRNLRDAAFTLVGSLSTYDVLVADAIVFTKSAFETFTSNKQQEVE
ncbi:MAG: large subunit ribosomal protein [Actinomycetota bacterium]|jgi:large subunit ribosomal protein L4|nr:large subunit ribosomal protein [Actinomycetota bacterium]